MANTHRSRNVQPARVRKTTGDGQPAPADNEPLEGMTEEEVAAKKQFIYPANDDHGHSSKEWVRLQPAIDRAMQILIEMHIFPYQTKSDIIRHAVHNHIPWLQAEAEKMGKNLPHRFLHFMACCDMIVATMEDGEYNQRMEKTFKAMQDKVNYHLDRSETTMAMHHLNKAKKLMENMEESPWKSKFTDLFGAKYGHLLKVHYAPKAGTRILAPDEELGHGLTETSSDEDDSDNE